MIAGVGTGDITRIQVGEVYSAGSCQRQTADTVFCFESMRYIPGWK